MLGPQIYGLFLNRQNPVYLYSVTFHPPEPGHLAFGKLVNGVSKEDNHVIVWILTKQILRHKLVFQAVIYQVICGDCLKQPLHFFHQAFL